MTSIRLIIKILDKIIPPERRRKLFRTPILYKVIKLLTINLLVVGAPFAWFFAIQTIKDAYYFPNTIYWIILPLLFISFPLVLFFYNGIFYLISPIQRYFNTVHKQSGLSSFSDSNKQIIKALLYISPLCPVVLLGIYLSYRGYPNEVVGVIVITSTTTSVVFMGNLLVKKFYRKKRI